MSSPFFTDTVAVAAAVVTVAGAAFGVISTIRSLFQRTIGRRRSQTLLLDQLACGADGRYIEALLGPPLFSSATHSGSEHIYRLPGAWVLTYVSDGSVVWFSITIRKKGFAYDVRTLTFGKLGVHLGRDTFARVEEEPTGIYGWTGARRYGYSEQHYFGNPGGYQHYWLSHSDSGVGHFQAAPNVRSGSYADGTGDTPTPEYFEGRWRTTVNTLTVSGPETDPRLLTSRQTLGADLDRIRVARGS